MARSIFLLAFVMVCMVMLATAAPGKDLKEIKKEAARKKACMHDCATEKYTPICAGKQGSKSLSFGSVCVMNNYNCDNHESFDKISDGECAGGDGVRLS